MKNKVLAMTAGVIPWTIAFLGVIEGYTGEIVMTDGLYTILGLLMGGFLVWASVRLYKAAEPTGKSITNKMLAISVISFLVASIVLMDIQDEGFTILFALAELTAITMLASRLYEIKD